MILLIIDCFIYLLYIDRQQRICYCHHHSPLLTTTDESMTRQQAPGEIFVPFNLKYSKHCHDTVTHLMSPLPLALGILENLDPVPTTLT